jgi:hypothetical protein
MSEGPPGGQGTTTVTVPFGQFCANALVQKLAAAIANRRMLPRKIEAAVMRNVLSALMSSPCGLIFPDAGVVLTTARRRCAR